MKKIIAICAAALLALAFTSESGAQNQSQAQPRQSAPVQDGEYDGIREFVDGLADIKYREEENRINGLDAVETVGNMEVNTLADVMALLPAFPSADQIINLDPAFNLNLQKFSAATNTIATGYTLTTSNVLADPKYSKGTTSASQRAGIGAGAMQIFAVMQKYGIDPDKATDEEMEAFMKKAIANGDIQMPSGKGQVFDTNYTDLQESEIDKVSDKVGALADSAQNLAAENAFWSGASPLQKSLDTLYDEAVATWKVSEAYEKVYNLEKDIDKRAWEYIRNHPESNNIGAEIPYPPFWVQGRKQENAIIREYNMFYLNQWTDKLLASLEKPIALLKELEAVDAELEKTFPDKTDLVYANLKSQLGASLVHIQTTISMLMGLAYSAPVINSVAESKVASM